mgnify:CR=1 FL=1
MKLTPEQQAMLNGEKGETMAKVVKTLVMYGDTFGAERMVPISSKYGHTVISFGLKVMKPVYDLYQEIIDAGLVSDQKFTADPKPLDKHVPSSLIEDLVFKKFMYTYQDSYEQQLRQLGITNDDGLHLHMLSRPGRQQARQGRGALVGGVVCRRVRKLRARRTLQPQLRHDRAYGLDSRLCSRVRPAAGRKRKATWIVELKCSKKPDAQLLGSAIGMKVMEEVPYVKGLDKWLGTALDEEACTYLKDFGAATASNGAVGLYHIENLTPEAVEQGESIIAEGAKTYVIDDAELERVKANYPVIWKNPDAEPQLCFVGCPHMTLRQLIDWTTAVGTELNKNGLKKVTVPTVFTASTPVIKEFEKTPYYKQLKRQGIILSYICPLMYMNNPLCKKKAVITSSNKLRTYTSARYYTEAEILHTITTKREGKK